VAGDPRLMPPLPFTHAGARIAFYVTLGIFVLLEQSIRVRSWRSRGGSSVDRGSLVVVVLGTALGVGGGIALASDSHGAAISFARGPIFIAGILLMWAGIACRQWAVVALGRFFTVDVRVHPEQTVVDSGPYRWVRHPSYTGLIIIFTGLGLALGNWAALGMVIVLPTAGLVVRIRVEERALIEGLGEPYRSFAAARSRLIPRVW
jgi:protein-S-isoprenylcysteine O-methyltransferase Ste14